MEKPAVVKTHLRNMIVVPEMIGSVVGIHNGKTFNQVEIKVCMGMLCGLQVQVREYMRLAGLLRASTDCACVHKIIQCFSVKLNLFIRKIS